MCSHCGQTNSPSPSLTIGLKSAPATQYGQRTTSKVSEVFMKDLTASKKIVKIKGGALPLGFALVLAGVVGGGGVRNM